MEKDIRFYQASTSEMFGKVREIPQKESTPFYPRSPYGCAKVYAYWISNNYRESYNMFCCNGILFNHESSRRGENFVTRKITKNLSRIKKEIDSGLVPKKFELGNIYARRDWSDSEDFVEAIWIMINKPQPKEYLLSSNVDHSVKEFIDESLKCLNLNTDCNWIIDEDNPLNTKLKYKNYDIITISEKFYRPAEVDILKGNCVQTLEELDWKPKTSFTQLVKKMILNDYNLLKKE